MIETGKKAKKWGINLQKLNEKLNLHFSIHFFSAEVITINVNNNVDQANISIDRFQQKRMKSEKQKINNEST